MMAYPPVVARGANAATIHYSHSSASYRDTDSLVLMDAGCELHGYVSDVTRTWPADSGAYTNAQRVLYDVVHETHAEMLSMLSGEGPVSIDDLYYRMQRTLHRLLDSANAFSPLLAREEKRAAVTTVCPHHVSHHLGMDVHDCALVSKKDPLAAGNVITVEPGVYVSPGCSHMRDEFKGVGIRIEDDVWIRGGGDLEILTSDCPVHPSEMERLVKEGSGA